MAEIESDSGGEKIYVRDHSSELNIESIISAPLIAASKANVVMVTGQTRFLLDYCFNKIVTKTSELITGAEIEKIRYEPVLIEMLMTRSNVVPESGSIEDDDYIAEHIEQVNLTFTIPLLCIIPINSLVIDKVTVDFDLDITSTTSYSSSGSGIIDKQAQLNGRISKQNNNAKDSNNSQYKSQSTSLLKVNINAGPLPLPIGVLTILDLYVKAISPTPINKKAVVISK